MIGLTADISKMYTEVRLDKRDMDNHRFIVRDNQGRLVSMRMKRLTFGIKPSPFVATSVLRHHATVNADRFPEASAEVHHNFYVDDCLRSR